MTAKEKAIELRKKYIDEINQSDFHVPEYISGISQQSEKYSEVLKNETNDLAKQCAMIAVDEIIKNLHWLEDSINFDKAIKFWQEVKTELNKL